MRIFFVCLMLLISAKSIGQLSIHGKVYEISQQTALPGVTIYIPDLKRGTITDGAGEYVMQNLPRGKFLIEFKSIGYSSAVKLVDVANTPELNVSLSTSVTELNEVVVTGVSHSTELKKNPVPITTINRDALEANVATNIIDNIARKPGVDQITTGAGISKPVIRGLAYNRIITLYDGIRQEGQQWGDEHGVEIDEYSVDRVEIVKGAGSLMYGSDGLGGVINFLAPNPVAEGKIESRITSNYQSNNGLIGNSVMNQGNIKGFYWHVRGSMKMAHPYSNNFDGIVFNSGFQEKDFNVITGINKSWGFTQFQVGSFNQTLGLVEGERDENGAFTRLKNVSGTEQTITVNDQDLDTYHIFIPRQKITHQRLSNSTNFIINKTRIQFNAGLQRNLRREYGNVLMENDPSLYFDLTSFNYGTTIFLPELSGWNISLGASGMSQQNKNKAEEYLIPEYNLSDFGGVIFLKKSIRRFDVSGGFRVDTRHIHVRSLYLDDQGAPADNTGIQKFAGGNPHYSNYSASAGLTYQYSERVTIKTNISRGYRAPNIAELASNGRHEGSLRYEYGNMNLKAENSLQADLGFIINSPHLTTEISVFNNIVNNYIYTTKLLSSTGTDSIPDPSEPVPAYQYVQGKAQLTGAEISIDIHPHPLDWLHIENTFAMVYAQNKNVDTDSAKYLPFTPAPRFQSELRATAGRWENFGNLFLKIQFQYYWKQDRVLLQAGTETPTPAYGLLHAGAGFDVTGKKNTKLFTFLFTATNVLDKSYQHHLSRLKYASENVVTGRTGVFNMGRNFSVKLIVPITFRDHSEKTVR
jgi:iron complex outermembrane receptor protein